ncbi:unnamed protein product [Rotaria sordida]|uniref:Uncharacterized protein n=1 Tax=Rotaria sordida TaxID=392033 RepID=A0A814YK88_9BILA|nr:unnamed protein product [Rotaria sordida]CAF1261746.1 unnamed protein product [Rotaria sordida]CAF3664131.1 unnamed protein product [Rotaria sordida]CAF3693011.1 unnamed protein product [Rotaria sordida]
MWSYILHCFLLLFLYNYQINTQQIPFDTIVSFGDSNSDIGNVYNLTNHKWPIVPPYFQGRFTNGPVWIEKLGISNIKNYAYGGATTDNNFIQGYTASYTIPVPGVRQQIQIYFNETNITTLNFIRTLYVIWIGGNDYYFNKTISPSTVVTSILNSVKDLLKIGAKYILITNKSPSQTMPFVQTQEQFIYYRDRNIYHNNNLSIGIRKLDYNHKEVVLYLFELYSFILKIIADNKNYSLNVKDYCWNVLNGSVTILCSNPESYVHIDQYHYTTRMHELIGDAVRQFLLTSSAVNKSSYSIFIILCVQFFLTLSFCSYEKSSFLFPFEI